MISLLLTACSGDKPVLEPLDKDKQVTLKVLFGDETSFYQQYGNFFNMKFPNVTFEVIPLNKLQHVVDGVYSVEGYKKAFAELAEKKEPDILFLDPDQYEEFVKKDKLYNLEAIIQQEKFDTDNIVPSIMQLLRDKGGGNIHGLAPNFRGRALFYNIDLFEKYGIELPRNQMTWEETLRLVQRFPARGSEKDREYGLNIGAGSNIYWLLYEISTTENLRLLDPAGTKVQFNTDSWGKVYRLAIEGVRSNKLNSSWSMQPSKTAENDLFLMGKAGMALEYSMSLSQLQRMKDSMNEVKPFRWGAVTVPVSAADPNTTDDVQLDQIYAINAKSPNIRAAWEFIKFVNGPEIAKMQSRIENFGLLSSRMEFTKDKEGHDLSAFYLLNQRAGANPENAAIPTEIFTIFAKVTEEESKRVLDDKQTVEQAIANIQLRLQEGLDQLKLKEKAAKEKEKEKAAK